LKDIGKVAAKNSAISKWAFSS